MPKFEMVILKLPVYQRIFMFSVQCLGFETTLRSNKRRKKVYTTHEASGEKHQNLTCKSLVYFDRN